jgi:putative spermidine/putrescine transport system permease protein
MERTRPFGTAARSHVRAVPSPMRLPAALFGLAAVVMLLPPLAVVAYAFSERWDHTLLPQGATLAWVENLFESSKVRQAVWHTTWISGLSAMLALMVGGWASIYANLHNPRLKALLDATALLPYAIPPVVVAIGALELFVGRWGAWLDLRAVYVLTMGALLFPLVHQTLSAAWRQVGAAPLVEAGRTLGTPASYVLRRVLMPVLAPSWLAAGLLAWTTAAMEFAIANLLLAGTVELLQPLMNGLRGANGHMAAALMVVSLILITLMGTLVHLLHSWKSPAPCAYTKPN